MLCNLDMPGPGMVSMNHCTLDTIGGTLSSSLGCWSSPAVSGTRPPPINGFSLTMTDDNHAVLFGGYDGCQKTNDMYTLDLSRMVSL